MQLKRYYNCQKTCQLQQKRAKVYINAELSVSERDIERSRLLIVNFWQQTSRAVDAQLPEIAHFNIFVHAHKNANESAASLQLWQNSAWQQFVVGIVWQL